MRQSYLKNAALMTGADVVLRLAGMGLRIYLAQALGGEGMGLYQLVLAVYALFVTLATAGVSVAATRLMAEELSTGEIAHRAAARGMLVRLLWAGAALGTLAWAAQFGLAGPAARWWLGDARAAAALRLSSFGLPWMAVAAVLRGFFIARRRVAPNVVSQLAEQALRIGVICVLLERGGGKGLDDGAQYGSLKGMALPLLTFPFGLLGSLSVLLMPEITQAHIRGEEKRLSALIDRMLRLTGYFSALAGAVFWVWGEPLAAALYDSAEAGFYLHILGPAMPLMYFESMVDGAMKGMGEQKAAFRYSVWDSILRIAGVVLLLPRFGMAGFLFVILLSSCYTCAANTGRLLAASRTAFRPFRWLGAPGLAGLLSAGAGMLLRQGTGPLLAGALPARLGALALGGVGMSLIFLLAAWPLGLGEELKAALARPKPPEPHEKNSKTRRTRKISGHRGGKRV